MKYFVKFFVVTFLALTCTYAIAEEKIVYIDMKYILNNSKAGKGAQDYLANTFKKNQKIFSDKEEALKKEETELLGKKNILSQEQYTKDTDSLRKKVIDYQSERKLSLDKITNQRTDAKKTLLDKINPILVSYSKENNITIILDKRFLVMGDDDLDITKTVISKLDEVLPSLNLK